MVFVELDFSLFLLLLVCVFFFFLILGIYFFVLNDDVFLQVLSILGMISCIFLVLGFLVCWVCLFLF